MEILVNAGFPPLHRRFIQYYPTNEKPLRAYEVRCLRNDENANSSISGPLRMELEGHQNKEILPESFHSSIRGQPNLKQNDIWKLFRDAQQNIIYLNKQRLAAVEELNKAQKEKRVLMDRIEQLELGTQATIAKGALPKSTKLSIFCELLLRIDSMVLTGLISTVEASDLRRVVMDDKVIVGDVFCCIEQKRDAELLAELRQWSDKSKRNAFHIVHICTEMAPVAAVGPLASYVTGLSCALQRKGNLAEVIMPKYASLDLKQVKGLRKIEAEFYSFFNGHWHANRIWTGVVYGIGITFIEPVSHSELFNRERIYGYPDDFERFTYFSRASLDYILKSGKQPDVLHIHNWQTAIIGPLFWDIFVNQGLGSTRILFTCHGFDSQCLEQPEKLAICGLDSSRLHRPDRLQDNIRKHLINILKGGVVYSNKVVVMSSIHSKSRIIHSLSHGLESTLSIHKDKLLIAPYGFNATIWDPSKDKFLPARYSAEDIKGKAICKVALMQHLGLPGLASTAVVGCLYPEVLDVDLGKLKSAVWLASRKGAQFIFMGASKIPTLTTALASFQKELKDQNVRFINKLDEALSHLIFAGSDIMLCPSFHDPVLQVPLKAIKYGAAPVAMTFNNDGLSSMERDFERTRSSKYILSVFANMTLGQALDQFKNDQAQWNRKIKDAMSKDFSWGAECYDVHTAAYTSIKSL
ncbi:probable starch synthase 4, chloroplastic/amyloplastic isoform X1 [Macadamia integrifolia]|uniref:probable starch synthase 4, chloroplastic/amyloplastic isoform X1 n=2 Tax=Macadamia integrifolia TaxID=60698 RepID=UPI001C4FA58A|nr:probable starch synthase 4, chloroplastic/amyloplastic isoform X1 [Macadamia integrifolia]XP_042508714.1 probable starch synthase 4, chloroplastic/amyloplastic isoform X1 [Macadamia integrifolia]